MPIPPIPEALKAMHPHLEERFWPYLYLLNDESPRGKVLISTGVMEELLGGILRAFMIENKGAEDLFEGGNPSFGTFSSRIAGCFALGLINQDEYDDLTRIRKIRNDFAHELSTSFDTPSVRDRCKDLKLRVPEQVTATGITIGKDAVTQFATSAVNLILNLVTRASQVADKRRSYEEWKY
jgi:mannitol operon repressor